MEQFSQRHYLDRIAYRMKVSLRYLWADVCLLFMRKPS